ncbi:DUF4388 domain-containing protein, partial [bacterium]|nr:DUF4388 domain-containing protein [bacterium]
MKKFPIEGSLQDFPVYRLLADLSGNRLSGVLTISGDMDTVDIYLSNGFCVRADSHYPRDKILFGQLMLARRYCSEEQLTELLKKQETELILLGKLANKAGYISDIELSRLIEDQILLMIYPTLSWTRGVYYFQKMKSVPYSENCFRPVDLKPIFRIGPKILKSWDWMLSRIPEDEVLPTKCNDVTVVSEGVQVEHSTETDGIHPHVLTRAQEKTFALIDGQRSIREVCDANHLFEWLTRMSILDLQDAGVISIPLKVLSKKKKTKEKKADQKIRFTLPNLDLSSHIPLVMKSIAGLVVIAALGYSVTLIPWPEQSQDNLIVMEEVSLKAMPDT